MTTYEVAIVAVKQICSVSFLMSIKALSNLALSPPFSYQNWFNTFSRHVNERGVPKPTRHSYNVSSIDLLFEIDAAIVCKMSKKAGLAPKVGASLDMRWAAIWVFLTSISTWSVSSATPILWVIWLFVHPNDKERPGVSTYYPCSFWYRDKIWWDMLWVLIKVSVSNQDRATRARD